MGTAVEPVTIAAGEWFASQSEDAWCGFKWHASFATRAAGQAAGHEPQQFPPRRRPRPSQPLEAGPRKVSAVAAARRVRLQRIE